ncbi:hypothetical protein [Megasphaera sp.]|uniref:hypothetical protein n=1 Tax=Megasphaera sp. TaxID=2023260 RepID=UPI0027B8ED89|nr:hypothetical protein [Megasphaera sp.]
MKWVVFFVKAILIFFLLWMLAIYLYGDFYLADNVVPEADMEIEEWLHSYYLAGGIAAIVGLVCSAIWYYFGINFSGGMSVSVKHTILWLLAFFGSFIVAFLVIAPAQEGSGLSFFFVGFLAPVGYYLNSLFNSAEAVKFIPPLGNHLHG